MGSIVRLTNPFRIVASVTLLVAMTAGRGHAQSPPAGSTQPPGTGATWSAGIQDTTRVEMWRFFRPHEGGGDPDYAFAGNRLTFHVTRLAPRLDVSASVQYVGLFALPDDAVGPGALGTGALYFAQNDAERHPQRVYLRTANLRLKNLPGGFDVRVGRQGYASGGEVASGEAALERIKRQRLFARLVGEFEWSLFQRTFDGVRVDWRRSPWHLTAVGFLPTQGGFAGKAGRTMTDVRVGGVIAGFVPSASGAHLELQGFVWHYDDERAVTGRPDNSGLAAAAADVAVTTIGGSLVSSHAVGAGRLDVVGWLATQYGAWYDQDHDADAFALEAGYQWPRAVWAPWLRAGWLHAGGDRDAADATHGTFFPMLPTVRRFSQTTAYSTMNLRDAFVQLQVQPGATTTLRLDLHRLTLASSADRWYAGSGATLSTGSNFGYVVRPSHDSSDLGASTEVSVSWDATGRWNLNGFAGTIAGGDVVTGSFAGSRLWFAYVESVLRLDLPWR